MRFQTFIGIDGCKAGWVAVQIDSDEHSVRVAPTVSEIFESSGSDCLALIDVPIGLSDAAEGRRCDKQARSILHGRRSSVFRAPAAATVDADTFASANRLSREKTGKGISKQAYALLPAIREVAELRTRGSKATVCETHPEVLFALLNKGEPMVFHKSTYEGARERFKLLEGFHNDFNGLYDNFRTDYSRLLRGRKVKTDDFLDAAVAAICAYRSGGDLAYLGETGRIDSKWRLEQMAYWKPPDI